MEKVKEALRIAFANLSANAIRSVLSIMGIVIGIAAVITILAIGAGAEQNIMNRINAMGGNVFLISSLYNSATQRMGSFDLEDIERIRLLPFVETVVPRLNAYREIRTRAVVSRGFIKGVDQNYLRSRELHILEGRSFSPIEIEKRALLCMLNDRARQMLFPGEAGIGESLYIDGIPWNVIGIYGSGKATPAYEDDDINVIVPMTSLLRSGKDTNIESLEVQVRPEFYSEAQSALLNEITRADPARKDLYSVQDNKNMFSRNLEMRKLLSMIGTIVAGISLIVGGIGMMNVMLTSVAERTREIGLRRAVGARKKDILFQFLIESCVLSGAGGIMGLIAGTALARGLPVIFAAFFGTMLPQIRPIFLLFSVGGGVLLGIVFGFYPAVKASRLSPAEALRSE